ncbi:LysR family transcriptional regulator [Jatrophihabitans cynanchi]|uniref:LysR family transcriptional regulator n=1 Tax=Jatrophihabitans cynanchi TaxID=2944128 RepID=A0ABY7K1H0_9ACTN|nr:LysR family transcriptional regulator [Jatrophihabitans sp. SB3-54]WAX58368.1 LysR family transcriptional regulator [Jatrophihabitans sp. SB3-54]
MARVIDLPRLRHVLLVAREGSFVRAAQVINMSQPALTRSVQATERQFGIKIFDRSRSGAILTRAGLQFIALTEDFVRRSEELESELRVVSSGGAGSVSFGLGPLAANLYLPELADLVFAQRMRAVVRVDNDAALRRLLLDGEIAFYVGGTWPGASEFAVSSRLRIESVSMAPTYGLLVRKDHPLLRGSDFSARQLGRYPVIGSSPIRRILDDTVLASLGLQIPSLEADNYRLLAEIGGRSDALVLAPVLLSGSRWAADLVALPVQLPSDRANLEACLVTVESSPLSPLARVVADRLIALLKRAAVGKFPGD